MVDLAEISSFESENSLIGQRINKIQEVQMKIFSQEVGKEKRVSGEKGTSSESGK